MADLYPMKTPTLPLRTASTMSYEQLRDFFKESFEIFDKAPEYLKAVEVRDLDNFDYRLERYLKPKSFRKIHKIHVLTLNWKGQTSPTCTRILSYPNELEREKGKLCHRIINELNGVDSTVPDSYWDKQPMCAFEFGPALVESGQKRLLKD